MSSSDPHFRFVTEAAALLHSTSPSTSAHLLGVQTRMLHADFKSLKPHQHKHHCAACGKIRGSDSSSVTVQPRKPAKTPELGGATVYRCAGCHRRAILPCKQRRATTKPVRASAAPSASASGSGSASTSASPLPTPGLPQSTASQPKSIENTSSKKRAKARKQGGLQALLASKQQKQPSLDLFDFLQ